jgi:hypothetical protein
MMKKCPKNQLFDMSFVCMCFGEDEPICKHQQVICSLIHACEYLLADQESDDPAAPHVQSPLTNTTLHT